MDTINVKAMFESLAGNFQDVLNSYRVFVCLNAAELYKNQPEPTISFNLDIADRKCTVDNLPVVLERGCACQVSYYRNMCYFRETEPKVERSCVFRQNF